MADIHQSIIVDFEIDPSGLESGLDRLAKSGEIDSKVAASFKSITAAAKGSNTEVKGLIETFNKAKTTATFLGTSAKKAFDSGVRDTLKQAGVSVKEFEAALKKAGAVQLPLKQELKNLTQAIAEAKVNGKDLGTEFQAMVKRAGELKDAMADANAEISNAGSDTRGIDNVIGSISALAGGFSAVQGAVGLFADENEDLQKALLKVNSALAISQGIQQVSNSLQKEGSLTKLADVVATNFQIAAQKIYTTVTGKATVATKGFKAALLATGIGAIITLVLALADAFGFFDDAVEDTTKSFERLNEQIDRNIDLSNKLSENIEHNGKLALNNLKLLGASEADQQKQSVQTLREQQALKVKLYGQGNAEIIKMEQERNKKIADVNLKFANFSDNFILKKAKLDNIKKQYDEEIKKSKEKNQTLLDDANKLGKQISESNSDFSVEEQQRQKENVKKRVDDAKAAAARLREIEQQRLEDEVAKVKIKLLAVQEETQEEVDLKKELIRKVADLDLHAEKLSANERKLIREQALKDQLDLQKEFNTKLNNGQLQAQIDRNNAELSELNVTNEERLRLTIENIETQSRLEVLAAKGNADKIAQITAKAQDDIRIAKLTSLEKTLEDEIALNNLRTASGRRALEAIVNDEKKSAKERIDALNSITNSEINQTDSRIALLIYEHDNKLRSEEEFTRRMLELTDQRNRLIEDKQKKSIEIQEQEDKKHFEFTTENAIETGRLVADFFSQINALSAAQENERIAGQKRQLQELIDAGAITKKDAEKRSKEIEILERQAKQRQAQRDKASAIFNAIVSTASAVTEALPNLILASIVGAFGAAQIALIAARPIPKFAKGKKDSYEGPGIIGEAGQEIFERNGRMFLTTKPTMIYLNKTDKVFSAKETSKLLHKESITNFVSHRTDKVPTIINNSNVKIDYDKLGQAIAKNQKSGPHINIDKDGITEWTEDKLQQTKYFNSRYKI